MIKRFFGGLLAIVFLLAGCQEKDGPYSEPPGGKGPSVVSSVPANGATGVKKASAAEVTITFDKSVMCPTAKRDLISIDNDAAIVRISPSGKNVVLSLADIAYGKTYKIEFPEGTVIDYDELAAKSFSIKFTVEDEPVLSLAKTLVTENPIPNATRLYDYLLSIYGKKTLSGAIAKVNWNREEIDWINQWTQKEPAMATFDYIHHPFSPANWIDYSDITPAKEWFDRGGIISACWHWNVPNVEGGSEVTCTPGDGTKQGNNWTTTFKPSNIFVEGSWENKVAKADLEEVAGYILLLQEQGIPVVWRPLHEAAGNTFTQWKSGAWFWWGRDGGETYVRLWRYMFDFFKQKGIRNLIWVWTAQATSDADSDISFYPGDQYVDIVGKDIYNTTNLNSITSQFNYVSNMVPNKMTSLSEHGGVSDIGAQWNAGAKWLYFMPWYDYGNDKSENYAHGHATISWWRSTWACDAVLDLSELPEDLYE